MATRIANVILIIASAVVFGFFCYLVGLRGWNSRYLALLMLIAGLLSALRLRPALRVNAVLILISLGMTLYVSELVLAAENDLHPVPNRMRWVAFNSGEGHGDERAIVATPSGISFHERNRLEVLRDLRTKGVDARPAIGPQDTETFEQTLKQSELKDILRDSLGPFYQPLNKLFWILWSIVLPVRTTEIYWLYLLSALAVGLGVYVWQHSKTRGLSFNKLLEFGLPRSIYAHKSAIVDYKYYFTFLTLRGYFALGTLIISGPLMGGYCKSLLQHIFGPVQSQLKAGLSARLIYTVLMVLAVDIGFFIAHYLEHKVPFFWEFHKVHHSAEVLTPITNYRLHPMDDILQGFFMNLFGGTVSGIFGYLFSNGLDKITILNVSVIMLAYYVTANLRHSHIWLSYGWALSHVFYSPAMHQIHHSVVERHVDKNFGFVFSFCDYLAGTLYVPREQEDLKWGLRNQEHTEYSSVWRLLVLPVKKAARLISRGILIRLPTRP